MKRARGWRIITQKAHTKRNVTITWSHRTGELLLVAHLFEVLARYRMHVMKANPLINYRS